jgi:hypothetical protein
MKLYNLFVCVSMESHLAGKASHDFSGKTKCNFVCDGCVNDKEAEEKKNLSLSGQYLSVICQVTKNMP